MGQLGHAVGVAWRQMHPPPPVVEGEVVREVEDAEVIPDPPPEADAP